MNEFSISVDDFKSKNFYLRMENLETKKKYHFIIFAGIHYWTIITLTNRVDLDRTIIKIIKTITELEILNITSRHLEDLIHEQKYERYVKGFIAKYKPYQSERNITVEVYGGDLKDLNKIRNIFFVEPTSFVYIRNYFLKINDYLYEKVESYDNALKLVNDGEGLTLKSRYAIVIKIKENRIKRNDIDEKDDDKITYEDLNKNIFNYFKNRKQRYQVYSEKHFSHFLCDKFTRNKVQLTIEPKYNNIIIYPINTCKGMTLRDICNGINEVESSIEAIEPYSYPN